MLYIYIDGNPYCDEPYIVLWDTSIRQNIARREEGQTPPTLPCTVASPSNSKTKDAER